MNSQCAKLLSSLMVSGSACRFVSGNSTKYFKPHPRSYRRRLYEAALAPILPPELVEKKKLLEFSDAFDFQPPPLAVNEYSEFDLAEAGMIRSWIREENFRVLGICQMLFVKESPRVLAQNQLRLKGLEFKTFRPKILRKVFEGTPFCILETMYDEHTVLLFGKEPNTLRTLVTECAKYNWLTLLAGTLDNRLFDVEALGKLAKLASLEDLRAETTQILGQLPHTLLQSLEHTSQQLVGTLDAIPAAAQPTAPNASETKAT